MKRSTAFSILLVLIVVLVSAVWLPIPTAARQLFQGVQVSFGTPTSPIAWPYGSTTTTDPHYGVPKIFYAGGVFTLQSSVTKGVSFSGTEKSGLGGFDSAIVTLDITSAERDSANETYDFYVTTGDGISTWDLVHFPQIATTGAKRYTAIVSSKGMTPSEITTAAPGVSAVMSGTLKTDTAGSGDGIKTLGAGKVRHGVLGDRLNHEVVIAGTVATGIVYSITVTVKQ